MAVGKKAQAYFRFRRQPVERQFIGMSDRPTFEDARRVAAAVVPPFLERRGGPGAGRLDPLPLGGPPGRRDAPAASVLPSPGGLAARPGSRRCPPWPRIPASPAPKPASGSTARRRTRSSATSSSSPTSSSCSSVLVPQYVGGLDLRGAARGVRLGAHRPPARHVGGHRERRGAHQDPPASHEPCPPGRDHHRDHGDRRRRRSAPLGAAARPHDLTHPQATEEQIA